MKKDFIFSAVNNLKGVGPQLSKYLKKKENRKNKRYSFKPTLFRHRQVQNL